MGTNLSGGETEVLERAARMARECLEPRAAGYDRPATHPKESWHDLWKAGFLAAAIPKEYGGLGLEMLTCVKVLERLAWGCTSTAMTMHMHSTVQRFIAALCTPEQKARFYPEVVEHGRMLASWGSEPERRGGAAVRDTTLAPTDGGYLVNGRKHFCTMAGAAHLCLVHCSMSGYDQFDGYTLALIPHDTEGMEISGEWDTLGMRATVSPAVSFTDCFVNADDVLGEPGEATRVGAGQGFGLGYAAVYIGAAQRALDSAVDFAKTQRFAPDPEPLSHNILIQRAVAEMTMSLEGARLVLHQSADGWESADSQQRTVWAARAKHLAMEASLSVTSKAIQTVGGRGAQKGMPLERLLRDVRTATLMPPNAERALEIVGRDALDVQDVPPA